ncbi:MAG: carboxypeptidase M32 [Caldilineaceae bacterium]|nr:carboxypeptidase M32 [Caldilineaceae bacterium]
MLNSTQQVPPQFRQLLDLLGEVNDLKAAADLLNWDQTTYMPSGGGAARGRQLATLQRLAHEKFTAPLIGQLLDQLASYGESLPPEADEAALLRVTRRDYERATCVPASFAAELANHTADSYEAWVKARPADDFGLVAPYLEKTLELSRQLANYFPGYQHIADPLINTSDYGMTVATLRPFFQELRTKLRPIVNAIHAQPQVDDDCLFQYFPEKGQWDFGLAVIKEFGYDFTRGRQDKTHHPFMTKFSLGDIRITTRIHEHELSDGIFSTFHEAGHALYEQGINPAFERTPLADGASAGIHESQSRLWENQIGRSLEFWHYYYPKLQAVFPDQLGKVPLETFYRAINKVQPSLIRVDADEVTYNLHVAIRFELELALLEGQLTIKDLPDAWDELYQTSLGVTAPNRREGVLQDVHWFGGPIGGVFQGYSLGNILAAQFYAQALAAHPTIPAEVAAGNFTTLHRWLQENIYWHGNKFTAAELVQRVTGGSLSLDPYLQYLHTKYGAIYDLKLA